MAAGLVFEWYARPVCDKSFKHRTALSEIGLSILGITTNFTAKKERYSA
jgi:hypothetical protein